MSEIIQIPFYIRFDEGKNNHSLSGIGESFIGLEELLPRLIEVSGVESEGLTINIKEVKGGCIILGLDINIITAVQIFHALKDFHDLIHFIGPDCIDTISNFHRSINDWGAQNPVDFEIIKTLIQNGTLATILSTFLVKLTRILPYEKERITTQVDGQDIPTKIAQKAHNLVNNNKFKKVLNPFVESKVKSMEFSSDKNFQYTSKINTNNFGDYLGENQQILPDWENTMMKTVGGKFVGWQRKKGNSLIFRVNGLKKYRDMVCYPDMEMKITDFTEYLPRENIELLVQISRANLYEKPRLIIHNIKNLESNTL